jgi:tetratricopeptide (TPR) repeat protein
MRRGQGDFEKSRDKLVISKNNQILLICLLLAAVTLGAFWQLNRCDFINFDDNHYVTGNAPIQNGVTGEAIRWAFTTNRAGNWHPLTWMSHMLDMELFGLNPHRHHLVNLLFHIANTLLLFFVLNRMTDALWKSAFVAALFALHPLHVESVAWISERKDVLSTFFWMLTLVAYVFYVKGLSVSRPPFSALRYLAVLIFFTLGLMSKPMLVSLPFVLLFLDYWPLGRMPGMGRRVSDAVSNEPAPANEGKGKPRRKHAGHGSAPAAAIGPPSAVCRSPFSVPRPVLREKIPLLVLAAFSCIITFIAQREGGAVKSTKFFSPGVRIANALISYVAYVGKTVWPDDLAVYYPHPGSWPAWRVTAAVFLLGAISVAVVRAARKFPYLLVGWLWFTVTLTPVIGFVQVGDQAMADRYTYVPLIGLFIMAAWFVPELVKKWRYCKQALFVLSALILAALSISTWKQAGYWRNSLTLYDHTLEVTGRNPLIYYNRGTTHFELGNYREAISDFDKAIEIDPEYPACVNRGLAYDAIADYPKAIENLSMAISMNPGLAWGYVSRGEVYGELGDYRKAVSDFERAVEIDPKQTDAYYNRGAIYSKLGAYRQAIEDFGKVIHFAPGRAEPYYKRGIAYDKLGDYGKAIEDYDQALKIDPKSAQSYNSRGVAYDRLGNYAQAISDYDRAVEIDPGRAMVFNNRGISYGKIGNYAHAIEDYSRAVQLDPGYVLAYYNRGVAYSDLGEDGAAVEDLKKAAALGCKEAKEILRSRGINR